MLLSDSLVALTAPGQPTVSSALAASPTSSVEAIAKELFKPKALPNLLNKLSLKVKGTPEKDITGDSYEPSQEDLDRAFKCGAFTTRPSDLFLKDPLAGMVSPSLMGATGVIPLTIVSVIPDIIAHMADVIVRTKREIFFATNFWEASDAASTITDAFKELSRRAGARGERVVIKMMYDRGTPKQVLESHQLVDEKTWVSDRVKLPSKAEIPNIDLEVMNFHKPPVGTFHAKYVVFDRQIAILQSNNIQDRVNVEMMTHIEGPIVNSFYDMALLSWNNEMHPPLPLLINPPSAQSTYDFGMDHADIQKKDVDGAKDSSRALLKEHLEHIAGDTSQTQDHDQSLATGPAARTYDLDNIAEAARVKSTLSTEQEVTEHLNTGTKIASTEPHSDIAAQFKPHVLHAPHEPFPMALVNRRPYGSPGHSDTNCPQDAAFLAAFRYATKKVFVCVLHCSFCHFKALITLRSQTPTFNASPVVEAALEAVRRGIEVTIIADLGFNDEGELLPFQGGTNEMVAESMYKKLETDAQRSLLRMYWYTGKDQKTPLNFRDKSRNCHVKLLIADEHIGIQGNGNQDVQSWYHSQEINVLIDSEVVCKEWLDAIHSNQNSLLHGELRKDGIWRDADGRKLPGAGAPTGPFKSLIGVKGAIQRVRGEGGF
ncbi:hypothetical protein RQP46_006716 [Phenoliferia psychrophenolica]